MTVSHQMGQNPGYDRVSSMTDVTRILSQIESGDPSAAEQLLPLVYEELRKLAAAKLRTRSPVRRSRPLRWCTRPTSGWWMWRKSSNGTVAGISLRRRRSRCGGYWLIGAAQGEHKARRGT